MKTITIGMAGASIANIEFGNIMLWFWWMISPAHQPGPRFETPH
jgi:hypothetical protein